eukprot:706614-Amphidinium_carterae.1
MTELQHKKTIAITTQEEAQRQNHTHRPLTKLQDKGKMYETLQDKVTRPEKQAVKSKSYNNTGQSSKTKTRATSTQEEYTTT